MTHRRDAPQLNEIDSGNSLWNSVKNWPRRDPEGITLSQITTIKCIITCRACTTSVIANSLTHSEGIGIEVMVITPATGHSVLPLLRIPDRPGGRPASHEGLLLH